MFTLVPCNVQSPSQTDFLCSTHKSLKESVSQGMNHFEPAHNLHKVRTVFSHRCGTSVNMGLCQVNGRNHQVVNYSVAQCAVISPSPRIFGHRFAVSHSTRRDSTSENMSTLVSSRPSRTARPHTFGDTHCITCIHEFSFLTRTQLFEVGFGPRP